MFYISTCKNLSASVSSSRCRWCSTSSSATFFVCGGVIGGSGDGGGGSGGSSLSSSDWRTPSADAERWAACSDGGVASTATLVSELTLRRSTSSSMRDKRQSSKKRARSNILTAFCWLYVQHRRYLRLLFGHEAFPLWYPVPKVIEGRNCLSPGHTGTWQTAQLMRGNRASNDILQYILFVQN